MQTPDTISEDVVYGPWQATPAEQLVIAQAEWDVLQARHALLMQQGRWDQAQQVEDAIDDLSADLVFLADRAESER